MHQKSDRKGDARFEQTKTSACDPARFFQIENKIDIIIEYDLASEIPLVK
jgi:hypothetical protein